jgi:predicted lactoylglutathione lyase
MAVKIGGIFVNVCVKDLSKSIAFFEQIGFTFNPQFTDENAACMLIGENMYAMLLTEGHFSMFTKKPIADATTVTEAIVALSLDSRAEVDVLVDQALAAGATLYADPIDHGFMYTRSFADLDGHQWEFFWMDPSVVQPTE